MTDEELKALVAEGAEVFNLAIVDAMVENNEKLLLILRRGEQAWLAVQDVLARHKVIHVPTDPTAWAEYWYCQGCGQECSATTSCDDVQAIIRRLTGGEG